MLSKYLKIFNLITTNAKLFIKQISSFLIKTLVCTYNNVKFKKERYIFKLNLINCNKPSTTSILL